VTLIIRLPANLESYNEINYILELIFNGIFKVNYKILREQEINFVEISANDTILRFENIKAVEFYSDITPLNEFVLDPGYFFPNFLDKCSSVFCVGSQKLIISEDAKNIHYISSDVLKTVFILAAGVFELNIETDKHNRVMFNKTIHSNESIKRPVINEIAFFLAYLLKINIHEFHGQIKYKIIPTHDVDFPYKYNHYSPFDLIKNSLVLGAKKDWAGMTAATVQYLRSKWDFKNDPFNFHFHLLNISEKNNLRSEFNFMSLKKFTKYDGNYLITEDKIKKLISAIGQQGHRIGFHPSYETKKNFELFKSEYNQLNKLVFDLGIRDEIKTGRQHYLRYDLLNTREYWNNCNLSIDSTLGYSEMPGFRNGLCCEYKMYSILDKKILNLKQRPLILMDVSITSKNYLFMRLEDGFNLTMKLRKEVMRYGGDFTILFHNNWFSEETVSRLEFYKDVIK